ncbi:NADH:flavin oxidoreductase/NADH oxidase [Metabacillus malikii]|uniref:2,4-dienoyl-CoA reductase-like NADH-dependent reductase (Old Yellow Enzyme family) n=1 Tax=Metabacillus malikii TaxID=1504265 RepID=A0ABT9ZJ85_9BACI|nr:NADH:flavin oxidoreductase/NADH oxidase [Metabacillus malikii]MDQ0232050.1 2,4-dienoyl-CoA reductase-like NADH-dependent reductase (Old Yellow Enzyme family) [Metabacillus malikii]
MPTLLDAFELKDLKLKNRIVMPPMCQYSVTNKDGKPNDWHFTHYTSRAIGGVGLIIMEMTDVEPDGRISDFDLGLWSDEQIPAFEKVIKGCQAYGAKVGIQIAHAGRKAEDAPKPVSSTNQRFSDAYKEPHQLSTDEVKEIVKKFEDSFTRAIKAGVDTIEIHAAHGYLIHQFQSPLTNKRDDQYGQDLSLFGVEIIQAARRVMPESMPLIMRISAVEYAENGYDLDYSIDLAQRYIEAGVDMFHVSSGGESESGPSHSGPGYQLDFAKELKAALQVPTIAVGRLEDPKLCDEAIREKKADLVAVGRGMLRNPYWANEASLALGGKPLTPRPLAAGYSI